MTQEKKHGKELSVLQDEEILALSVGAPSSFEILVDRYQEAFLRKARSIVGYREEAEDIVMETFTKIYLNAGKFKVQPGASFKSWGYKILINTALSYYQKLKRDRTFTQELDPELYEVLPDTAQSAVSRLSTEEMLAKALSRIPSQLARIVTLHFLEDRPQQEVAEMEGLSLSAVKTRIHRAKKALKKLGEDHLLA